MLDQHSSELWTHRRSLEPHMAGPPGRSGQVTGATAGGIPGASLRPEGSPAPSASMQGPRPCPTGGRRWPQPDRAMAKVAFPSLPSTDAGAPGGIKPHCSCGQPTRTPFCGVWQAMEKPSLPSPLPFHSPGVCLLPVIPCLHCTAHLPSQTPGFTFPSETAAPTSKLGLETGCDVGSWVAPGMVGGAGGWGSLPQRKGPSSLAFSVPEFPPHPSGARLLLVFLS